MVHICKQCRRVNPREAVHRHHDGVLLSLSEGGAIPTDGRAINVGTKPFTVPFVFPSSRACYNYLQMAEACQQEQEAAIELLHKGHLETFLASQGRTDLAGAAHAAARAADAQRGLDDFLGGLPFSLSAARLRIEPAVFDLGTVRVGEDRRLDLSLRNEGKRLVYGSAVCDALWLSLGEGPRQPSKLFQFTDRMVLSVRILGQRLRAFDKPQQAEIRLESNGGNMTVSLRVQVPVQPFAAGMLAGAHTPREWAAKAKKMPKEAAALIESGAVARWYESNGWTYPVPGPAADGVAAVQQFFEALGLVKTPTVELSEDVIHLQGRPGEKIEYTLAVITQENRAAIAHGSSDQAWLQVGPSIFRGRSAFLPLKVAAVAGQPGETVHAVVSITANGGKRCKVPVTLTVGAVAPPPLPAPPAYRPMRQEPARPVPGMPVPQAAPAPPRDALVPPAAVKPAPAHATAAPPALVEASRGFSLLLTLLPALLLFLVAVGGAVHDWLEPEHEQSQSVEQPPFDATPRIAIRSHEVKRNDLLDTLYLTDRQATMRFGIVMLRKGKEIGTGVNVRRLTFDPWGRTNNTCFRLDRTDDRLFGSGDKGHWEESAAESWRDDKGQKHKGVKSVWLWDDKKIEVTQFVELVRGQQSELLDTCRVRYRFENRDARAHEVGIRFLLDTFIGGNDGVPFTIPGEPSLCDTMKDLPAQAKDHKIPDFLQALEKANLARPGTIAHLRLKLENLEPPVRVTLGAWPNEKLRVLNKLASGPLTLWDVPLVSLKSFGLNDSAITIYWKEKPLEPRASREVGFEYGLWNLATKSSRLATTVDGAFRPDGALTVIAYVKQTGEHNEETVTLKLPEGFKLLQGAPTQRVPRLPRDARSTTIPITWRVQVGPTGAHEFIMTSSFGMSQTLKVDIRKSIY